MSLSNKEEFGKVKFTDKGFSIRVGHWGYFATHDECRLRLGEVINGGIAYDLYPDGKETDRSGHCADCHAALPKEMGGLINMLIWEK